VITIYSYEFYEYKNTVTLDNGNRHTERISGANVVFQSEDGLIHEAKTTSKCVMK